MLIVLRVQRPGIMPDGSNRDEHLSPRIALASKGDLLRLGHKWQKWSERVKSKITNWSRSRVRPSGNSYFLRRFLVHFSVISQKGSGGHQDRSKHPAQEDKSIWFHWLLWIVVWIV